MSGKNLYYLSAEDFFLQPIYSCIHCRANLAHHTDLISKSFQGSQGRAYLFNNVVNVGSLIAEERMLLTGLHYVADIYCECCSFILGWKYERAFEPNQRYKEGKYIIELANLIKDNGWDVDYPRIRTSYSKENRRSFSIDWEESCDNISRGSFSRQSKSQTKSTFIKELSRDFQYLFGFYEKNNVKIDLEIAKEMNVVIFNEEMSNSVMTTSTEEQATTDILRLHSIDKSNVSNSSEQKLKTNYDTAIESGADNSSLNTSCNSTKGLLGASCSLEVKSIDLKVHKSLKSIKSNKCMDNITTVPMASSSQYLPSFEPSLSSSSVVVVSGTSTEHSNQQNRHCSRHKHKSRHSTNVVNPQKTTSIHRRHHHHHPTDGNSSSKNRSQETVHHHVQ